MASFELLNANVMLKCTQRMPACSCLAGLKICLLTISSLVEGFDLLMALKEKLDRHQSGKQSNPLCT